MNKLKAIIEYIRVYPKRFFSGLILCTIYLCITVIPYTSKLKEVSPLVVQAQKLEASYNLFRLMTPKEFYRGYASLIGEETNYTARTVFQGLGGCFDAKDADIGRELNAALELDFVKQIYDYSTIQPGDFIMFKPRWINGKLYTKACVIIDYKNGYIRYVDNDPISGLALISILYNDYTIDKIVLHTFNLWSFKQLEKSMRVNRSISPNHDGIDLSLSSYDRTVSSFTRGAVVKAYNHYNPYRRMAFENTGGNQCVVKMFFNGKFYYVAYMHLINLKVKLGDWVDQSTILGNYADVGYSFGAHLHMGLYENFDEGTGRLYNPIDPMYLVMGNASRILWNTGHDIRLLASI